MRMILILAVLAGNLLPPAAASGNHPLEDIRQSVLERINQVAPKDGEPWHVELGHLDPRLHLKPCDQALETFVPNGGIRVGNITVGVRCNGATPWKLYLPVSIRLFTEVVVLRQPVSVGGALTAADLHLEKRDVSQMASGYFRSIAEVEGKLLQRSTAVGRVLSRESVANPALVRRGQKVTLQATTAGFEIRVEGEALSNAGFGERIKVRNLSSRRVVEGIVGAGGRVLVGL